MITSPLAAIVLGILFGWALQKAGLTHYHRIVNVYRFSDMTVMRFMLTALVVAGVLIQGGIDLGYTKQAPLPATNMVANAVGGLVFGVGMASAGYCPGTIAAELAEGRADALIAGIGGLLVGAITFGLVQPHLMPLLTKEGSLGRVSLPTLMGANPWLVLLVFAQIVLIIFLLLDRSNKTDAANENHPLHFIPCNVYFSTVSLSETVHTANVPRCFSKDRTTGVLP